MHIKLHKPFIGIEGDVSHYGLGADSLRSTDNRLHLRPAASRLARLDLRSSRMLMVGGEHSANSGGPTHISETALAYALGGGLDLPIAPLFAWRVAGDYIHAVGHSPWYACALRHRVGLQVLNMHLHASSCLIARHGQSFQRNFTPTFLVVSRAENPA